jgi:16S rRNA (guanine527-N7)-methyltransferase
VVRWPATGRKTLTTTESWPELEQHCITQLQRGCEELGLSLDDGQQERLLDYLALLSKWNKTYNLTAVRDERQMVTRHLLDSLAIVPHVSGARVIDVGTGAGLPGIPLAIVQPQHEVHLLDSNGKKTRFLFQVKTALRLDNIVVHQARVETFRTAEPFDAVLSRAFASLQDMALSCRHLLVPGGCLLAMKGTDPAQEIEELNQGSVDVEVYPLVVPGLVEQRHLVKIALQQGSSNP